MLMNPTNQLQVLQPHSAGSVIANLLHYVSAPQTRSLAQSGMPQRQMAAVRAYQEGGNRNVDRMLEVMRGRLNHHNLDGSFFSPRLMTSIVLPGYYQLVILNAQALWHFDKNDFTNPNMLAALSGALQLNVRLYARQDERFGITYLISFRDFPSVEESAVAESARLPKTAPLDLGARRDLRDRLMVPLGVSAQGEVWKPLHDMRRGVGHALIVGVTGSGKTSWMHSALAALLTENSPSRLNLALVDPKRGELMLWNRSPHLWKSGAKDAYACEPADVRKLLEAAADEMDRRGNLRAGLACQDIAGYNEKADHPLPYLLVVVDEFLDLSDDKAIIASINALARRGRSEGIFLWLASHSATTLNGLPGPTKANLSTRIVCRLDTPASANALDCPGAHEIPRSIPGRMLVRVDVAATMMQGYFLSNAEIVAIAHALADPRRAGDNAANGPALTKIERELLTWALEEGRGYLSLSDIRSRGQVGQQEAMRMAKQFEDEGWLEKDPKARNKRRVTQKSALLLGAPTGGMTEKL